MGKVVIDVDRAHAQQHRAGARRQERSRPEVVASVRISSRVPKCGMLPRQDPVRLAP